MSDCISVVFNRRAKCYYRTASRQSALLFSAGHHEATS